MNLRKLNQMVETFADEEILNEVNQAMDRLHGMPAMAQVEGLFRRAQGARSSFEIFKKEGESGHSFEDWLEDRIALARRRGKKSHRELAYFILVQGFLFGKSLNAIKRASSALLKEQGIQKASLEQRQAMWEALFKKWIAQIYLRSRYLIRSGQSKSHKLSGRRN